MKKNLTLLVVLIAIIFSIDSFAGKKGFVWNASRTRGVSGEYAQLYNSKTLETIKGEIIKIRPYRGMRSSIHSMAKKEKDQTWVHLGPIWYVLNQ